MRRFVLYDELYECEQRLKRACTQIIQLDSRLDELHRRYQMAHKEDTKCFRLALRNRMLVTEGMLIVYCKYAYGKKREILKVRRELYGEAAITGSGAETEDPDHDDLEDGYSFEMN